MVLLVLVGILPSIVSYGYEQKTVQREACMRTKTVVFLVILLAFLFTFPRVIIAQGDLTETYTSPDGKFSISYPAGYTVNDE